ncbi:MAG TPA: tyrosine-type recombinase/integrase [Dongiaceae bacterium]|nr:tyrosine-type recombinase/integrase [Dongiaceae bacterium]
MPIVKLTARSVARLKPPGTGQTDYWDDSLPGFGLRVSAGGRRAWVLLYRHGTLKRRLTLGPYPDLPLSAARDKARDHLREVAHGRDPAAEKAAGRKAETFEELAENYLERYAKKRKRSWRTDELALARDLLPRFATVKATAVTRRDINRLLDSIVDRGAPIQANRTLGILRRIYSWGIERDIVAVNPCQGIRAPGEEKARDRVLAEDELRAVWNALAPEPAPIAAMFKLRLLTAQRGGEVATIRLRDLDLAGGWWTIPGELSKNGLAHRVPLAPQAIAIIEEACRAVALAKAGDWLFPSPIADGPLVNLWRAVARIRKRSGVDFRPHDLRRTAASLMTGMGISRLTVSKILNHVESNITAVYDRHSYDAEKRQALEAWAARVEQIVSGRTAGADKVVPLRLA